MRTMVGKVGSLILFLSFCVSTGNAQQDKSSKDMIGRSYRVAGEKLEVRESPDLGSPFNHLSHNEIFTIVNKPGVAYRIKTKAGKEFYINSWNLYSAEKLGQIRDTANDKILSGFKDLSFGSSIGQAKRILRSGYKETCNDKIYCDEALEGGTHSYFDLLNVSRASNFGVNFFNAIGLYSIGIIYPDSDKQHIKRVLNIKYGEPVDKGDLYREWNFWDFPNAVIRLWDKSGPQIVLWIELKQGKKIQESRRETAAQKAAEGLR